MGLLITFEGLDGSGKSTQIARLIDRIRKTGRDAHVFREPGGTVLSESVRSLLLDPDQAIDPFAELLLFSAARAQLVAERIRPLLKAGEVVVLDRFYDSTTAYQGAGRGIAEPDWLDTFHRRVTGGLVPDRTYLIDIDPEEAARRQGDRDRGTGDRMEQSGRDFFERARAAYRALADRHPARFRVLDGTETPESIAERIWEDASPLVEGAPGAAR